MSTTRNDFNMLKDTSYQNIAYLLFCIVAETRSIFLIILHHSFFAHDEMSISEHISVSFDVNPISEYCGFEGTTKEEDKL